MNKYIKYKDGEVMVSSAGVFVSIEDISLNMMMDKWSTRELMRKMGKEACHYCDTKGDCIHQVVSRRLLKKRA